MVKVPILRRNIGTFATPKRSQRFPAALFFTIKNHLKDKS